MKLIPLFHFYKLSILLWLSVPPFSGAQMIHKNLVRPLLAYFSKQLHRVNDFLTEGAAENTVQLTPSYSSGGDIGKKF